MSTEYTAKNFHFFKQLQYLADILIFFIFALKKREKTYSTALVTSRQGDGTGGCTR